MVNLLPAEAKRQITVEYYARVATVWLFLLTGAMAVLGALLVPISVLVGLQLNAYDETFSQVLADQDSFTSAEAEVTSANAVAGELARLMEYPPIFADIALVTDMTGPRVTIDSYAIERAGAHIGAFTITGEAATRAELAAFRDRIEAHERFVSAALPLSNLAKDKEIPFSITISVASSTPPNP